MDRALFAGLVRDLLETMGQSLAAARPIAEGFALRTDDRFLYVFVEAPASVDPDSVRRWREEADVPGERLVVFSIEPAIGEWASEVGRIGGMVVAGSEFRRLVDELGIDSPLLEKDPSIHRPLPAALPSARGLDAEMVRAKVWLDAGVAPLAIRFYRRAIELKPEFVGAWSGLARAQSDLGAWPEAEDAWRRVLDLDPGSIDARLGLARAAGGKGETLAEVEGYRAVLEARPDLLSARAQLLAALVERQDWSAARWEAEALLRSAPSDGRLHFVHALILSRLLGETSEVAEERTQARRLGLTESEEREIARTFEAPDRSLGPAGRPEGF